MIRCSDCEGVFPEGDYNCCPACGSKSVPQNPANDISLKINTHDLRCLTIWATNHARQHKFSAESVIRRVRRGLPETHAKLALTMEDEAKALSDALMDGTLSTRGGTVEMRDSSGRIWPKSPQDGDTEGSHGA